ncbi:MAG: hypothetical protein RMN25_08815 [Anaerolineae bacterium]|nr:hypothetical protein [Thermoflexales bacterium]MDW8407875.1 hypothetical protein [Anaerolineae bacterium]
MNWQRTFPVVASILIILAVAVLRDRSKLLATLFATMPINMPLALWVLASGSEATGLQLAEYARGFFIALIPGLIWLGVVYLTLRLGWSLIGAVAAGYAVWGVMIAGLYALRILTIPK